MTAESMRASSPHAGIRCPERSLEEQILQHFRREFPNDPIQAHAKFLAKASHAACNGTGLLTYLRPNEGDKVADLYLCDCARRRRDRFISKALHFCDARRRQGLAFAERT